MERASLIELDSINHGEYYLAQVAVDGVPSVPFFAHKSVREIYPKDEQFLEYLFRMGKATIARCGDARNPLPQAVVEGVH